MSRSISKILTAGFIPLIPVVLAICLLYRLAVKSEQILGDLLNHVLPDAICFLTAGVTGTTQDRLNPPRNTHV